jgi:DHA3 family macrolide efflux protein-like MFS transporter
MSSRRPTGLFGFTVVSFGQFVSMLGSGMTRFALTIWAWQETGEATALALVAFFSFAPVVVFSPIAGAIVDRVNRKLVMILSDLAAGLSTVVLLILHLTGHLQIWHLMAAGFFAASFESFQFPAYSAAISTMMEKRHYARANAMQGLAASASGIVAPMVAGFFLAVLGINGIMAVDIATFLFAIGVLLFVFIPNPPESEVGRASRTGFLSESLFGLRYIFGNSSLLGLQSVFFAVNFVATFGFTVLAAMILARTGSNEIIWASVQAAFGIGGVVGGLVMTAWGGPKRRVHGVLLGMASAGVLGYLPLGLGQSLPLWATGAFFTMFFIPILNGSNQALWQAKVPPDIQGKVFAARRMIAQISAPIAMLIAGPLADRVFEPAMRTTSALSRVFGPIVGTGPGAGMGLMFVFVAILSACVGLGGYLFRAVRNAEDLLPDHDAAPPASAAADD